MKKTPRHWSRYFSFNLVQAILKARVRIKRTRFFQLRKERNVSLFNDNPFFAFIEGLILQKTVDD